jgi:hypothetical protein
MGTKAGIERISSGYRAGTEAGAGATNKNATVSNRGVFHIG